MTFKILKGILIPLLFSFILISCSDNKQVETDSTPIENTTSTSTYKTELEENQIRVLTLPTPVQLAAVMNSYGIPYNQELLTPVNETKAYSSNYSRSVCAGIYAVNLGYSSIFGDNENSYKYFQHLNTLFSEMSVKTYPVNEIGKRFGDNLNNPDSLSKIILETYNKAHQYLIANEQEQQGFFILSGSYIEGLSLISKAYLNGSFGRKKVIFSELFCQHQIFLNNLLEISEHTTSKDSNANDLDTFLHDLNEDFEKFEIKNVEGKLVFGSKPKKEDIISIQQKIETFKAKVLS